VREWDEMGQNGTFFERSQSHLATFGNETLRRWAELCALVGSSSSISSCVVEFAQFKCAPERRESGYRIASGCPKIDREVPLSSTGDLLCCGAACLGNMEWVVRAIPRIQLLLPRKVKLSNCAGRELDVSLGPAGARKKYV